MLCGESWRETRALSLQTKKTHAFFFFFPPRASRDAESRSLSPRHHAHALPPALSLPLPPSRQAFNPGALGILLVTDVPDLPTLRAALLPCAHALAARLSPAARARLEDPASSYQMGWSHGREALVGGRPDTAKGSFYANPLVDDPGRAGGEEEEGDGGGAAAVAAAYPGLARPCVWPVGGHGDPAEDALAAALAPAFRGASAAMAAVGRAVAAAADALLASRGTSPSLSLVAALGTGRGAKGRLLYYFPPGDQENGGAPAAAAAAPTTAATNDDDGWCGWHVDHSLLTVLCPAAYLSAGTGEEVACPDGRAGLWVRARGGGATPRASGPATRVTIPAGALAVQFGEAAQVLAGGALVAAPHCVRPPGVATTPPTSRASFALFLQPWVTVPLTPPAGRGDEATVGVPRWRPGDTFGKFSERTVAAFCFWGEGKEGVEA